MRIFVFFFLLGQFFLQAKAQVNLSGRVIDQSDNQPIVYASVVLKNLEGDIVYGVVTDVSGTFQFEVKPATYQLNVSFLGYQPYSDSLLISGTSENIQMPDIVLTVDSKVLEEIEISGKKESVINKIDRQEYKADAFTNAKGGTATDVIKNLPSITLSPNGKLRVRGATGFVVMVDGKPLQGDPLMFLNQIPANLVESVELITAPSAKFDPEGKAGIINLKTTKESLKGYYVQLNSRLGAPSIEPYDNANPARRYGGDVSLNLIQDRFSLAGGFSYQRNDISGQRIGDVNTTIGDTFTSFPSAGERSFDEENISGRLLVDFLPDNDQKWSLGFYGGTRNKARTADILYFANTSTNLETNNTSLPFQYYNENLRIRRGDFFIGSLDYIKTWNNKAGISTSLLYEYTLLGGPTTNRNLGWPNTSVVYQDEYNTNDNPLHGIRFVTDYYIETDLGKWQMGYQFRWLDHFGDFVYERKNPESNQFELVPEFSIEVELVRNIHAVYTQLDGTNSAFDYSLGLRFEYMQRELDLQDKTGLLDTSYLYSFIQPFPSLQLQYNINDQLALKGSYSRRVERTTTFKMNPFPEREHSETLEQGDPTLLPEFSGIYELGVTMDWNTLNLFGNTYYRRTQNLVNRVNTVFNDTILNRIYSNVGTANSIGFDGGFDWLVTNGLKWYGGANIYRMSITGEFDDLPVNTSDWIYTFSTQLTANAAGFEIQALLNYVSEHITAQGSDSRFFSPSLVVSRNFLDQRLQLNLQWQHVDMGLWGANEQRITTFRANDFFTTTNYIYEVDIISLNASYTLSKRAKAASFIKSEFGEREF